MRPGNLFSKRGGAVLDAPEPRRAPAAEPSSLPRRVGFPDRSGGGTAGSHAAAGSFGDDFGDELEAEGEFGARTRRTGVRLSFQGGLPRSVWGRVAAGAAVVLVMGLGVAGILLVRGFLLRDDHFTVQSPAAVEIEGNTHLTRPQLLSVFGEDVERNVFKIPLAERRAELESLPWVGHATVMRLLPNRVRVSIVERTPVAFVRQGSRIGLVDADGVLLDMGSTEPDGGAEDSGPSKPAVHYSFPVLTGISAEDPVSTRAARMRIYMAFIAAMDASGERISAKLSEVDLSNPEDVKAILPDGNGSADILVHFGSEKFLERYRKYEEHLAGWRAQYPKLASVDMRYERQVVLEMQPGSAVPVAGVGSGEAAGTVAANSPAAAKGIGKAAKKAVAPSGNGTATASSVAKPTPTPTMAATASKPKSGMAADGGSVVSAAPHLTSSFTVAPAGSPVPPKPMVPAVKVVAKPPAASQGGTPR